MIQEDELRGYSEVDLTEMLSSLTETVESLLHPGSIVFVFHEIERLLFSDGVHLIEYTNAKASV
jgi:hypothetical protein